MRVGFALLISLVLGCSGADEPKETSNSQDQSNNTAQLAPSAKDRSGEPAVPDSQSVEPIVAPAEPQKTALTDNALAQVPDGKAGTKTQDAPATQLDVRMVDQMQELASYKELLELLDLRQVQPLKPENIGRKEPLHFDYMANGSVDQVKKHHFQFLESKGWDIAPSAESDDGSYQGFILSNDRRFLRFAVYDAGEGQAGVELEHLGGLDAQSLPFPDAAEAEDYNSAWMATYRLSGSTEESFNFCRTGMHERGWQEFKNTDSPRLLPNSFGETQVAGFVKGSALCYLVISTHVSVNEGQPTMSYVNLGLLPHGLTVPPEAQQISLAKHAIKLSYVIPSTEPVAREQLVSLGSTIGERALWIKPSPTATQELFAMEIPEERCIAAELKELDFQHQRVSFWELDYKDFERAAYGEKPAKEDVVTPSQSEPKGSTDIASPVDAVASSTAPENIALGQLQEQLAMLESMNTSGDMDAAIGELRTAMNELQTHSAALANSLMNDSEVTESSFELPEDSDSEDEVVTRDYSKVSKAAGKVSGTVQFGNTTVTLEHGLVYYPSDAELGNAVFLFTDSALPKSKAIQQLANEGELSLFDLSTDRIPQHVEITVTSDNEIWCNVSIAGASTGFNSDNVVLDQIQDGGWHRGALRLVEPRDVMKRKLTFDIQFDLAALDPTKATTAGENDDWMTLRDKVPVPRSLENQQRERSKYLTLIQGESSESWDKVVAGYSKYFAEKSDWQATRPSETEVQFNSSDFHLTVQRTSPSSESEATEVAVEYKDIAQARKDKMLPPTGRAKLLLVNTTSETVAIQIGKQTYQLKPEQGADDPREALNYDVAIGKYPFAVQLKGQPTRKDSVQLEANTTWVILVTPSGEPFATRFY